MEGLFSAAVVIKVPKYCLLRETYVGTLARDTFEDHHNR